MLKSTHTTSEDKFTYIAWLETLTLREIVVHMQESPEKAQQFYDNISNEFDISFKVKAAALIYLIKTQYTNEPEVLSFDYDFQTLLNKSYVPEYEYAIVEQLYQTLYERP